MWAPTREVWRQCHEWCALAEGRSRVPPHGAAAWLVLRGHARTSIGQWRRPIARVRGARAGRTGRPAHCDHSRVRGVRNCARPRTALRPCEAPFAQVRQIPECLKLVDLRSGARGSASISWRRACRRRSAWSTRDRTTHSAHQSASICRRSDRPCIPTSFPWRQRCRRAGWRRRCRACPTEN